jgi:hypothetical protein
VPHVFLHAFLVVLDPFTLLDLPWLIFGTPFLVKTPLRGMFQTSTVAEGMEEKTAKGGYLGQDKAEVLSPWLS